MIPVIWKPVLLYGKNIKKVNCEMKFIIKKITHCIVTAIRNKVTIMRYVVTMWDINSQLWENHIANMSHKIAIYKVAIMTYKVTLCETYLQLFSVRYKFTATNMSHCYDKKYIYKVTIMRKSCNYEI